MKLLNIFLTVIAFCICTYLMYQFYQFVHPSWARDDHNSYMINDYLPFKADVTERLRALEND